jgi:hypothetical protein
LRILKKGLCKTHKPFQYVIAMAFVRGATIAPPTRSIATRQLPMEHLPARIAAAIFERIVHHNH